MVVRISLVAAAAALFAPAVHASVASAPPVGPLPPGQVTTVSASSGALIAVAPRAPASGGLVWRLARGVNAKILRETAERNIGRDVIVVYKAVGPRSVTVAYGLTKGETRKAYKSVTYKIRIR